MPSDNVAYVQTWQYRLDHKNKQTIGVKTNMGPDVTFICGP